MLELNFLAFCITIIALTAIVYGKEDVAVKALSTLSEVSKGFMSAFGNLFKRRGK